MSQQVDLQQLPLVESVIHKKRQRSNGGCGNCKKRKIKCDERKPSCSKCQSRHLVCPGYRVNTLKWSSKHEVLRPDHTERIPAQPELIRSHQVFAQSPSTVRHPNHPQVAGEQATGLQCVAVANTDMVVRSASPETTHFSVSEVGRRQQEIRVEQHRKILGPGVEASRSADVGLFDSVVDGNICDRIVSPDDSEHNHLPRNDAGDYHAVELVVPSTILDVVADDNELLNLHEGCDQDRAWDLNCITSDGHYSPILSSWDLQESSDIGLLPLVTNNHDEQLIYSPASNSEVTNASSLACPLPATLLHVPTVLVEYYFQNVCRECSTFDSNFNPFRYMVSKMRVNSASMNYAIQSLAASKLADDLPRMKVAGIEAQGLALESLNNDCSAVSALSEVSDAVLCTILLLGMTTSWHVPHDIGLEYLALARRIITAKVQSRDYTTSSNLAFYQNALKYWTMIISIVSGDADKSVTDISERSCIVEPTPAPPKKIMPHPWTGISPVSQQLFGDTLRLIRKTRISRRKASSTYSRASLMDTSNAISTAERLEEECWSVIIPSVDELDETGDLDTPPVHHVLTAKAYLLSTLLHIYMLFPDVLDAQIKSYLASKQTHTLSGSGQNERDLSDIKLSRSYLWPERSDGDPHHTWVRDIGLRIVKCLEQISVRSGTRVVHVPLLLSVASALTLSRHATVDTHESNSSYATRISHQVESQGCLRGANDQSANNELNAQIRQCRAFTITRLETMRALMRFHAIDKVFIVIKEVWRRADAGSVDVFWMDVMSELGCETLFG